MKVKLGIMILIPLLTASVLDAQTENTGKTVSKAGVKVVAKQDVKTVYQTPPKNAVISKKNIQAIKAERKKAVIKTTKVKRKNDIARRQAAKRAEIKAMQEAKKHMLFSEKNRQVEARIAAKNALIKEKNRAREERINQKRIRTDKLRKEHLLRNN